MQELIILLARFLIIIPIFLAGWCLFIKREWKTVVGAVISILVVNVLSEITKAIIPTARPFVGVADNPGIWVPFSYGSFFSGHTATLFALGVILYRKHKKLALLCFGFGGLVGVLRVIIKVHYPIDIIGGAVVGVLVGLFAIRVEPIRQLAD
ncbi:MAG: phosphatase PAP2 family protein [Patescibacteria group bacterium]|nr:phosphatase PAP2 family protein [Patescibacteria group bacterium]